MRSVLLAIVIALSASTAFADSPESLVKALYEAVSAAPGEKHDWKQFRELFIPEALMMVRTRDGVKVMSLDTYIAESSKQEGTGFIERELVGRIQKYGHVAHAWSSYEATFGSGEMARKVRGVNSLQMVQTDGRWRIAVILWESDRTGGELPADLSASPVE